MKFCLVISPPLFLRPFTVSSSLWDLKLRDVGQYVVNNFSFRSLSAGSVRMIHAYRAKYITCKNARLTPFWHAVGLCILLNYMVDYNHLKHERMRKYH